MSTPRIFGDYESKWQKAWDEQGLYHAAQPGTIEAKEKFYGLVEFPFPSGAGLHVGHPRSYVAIDVVTRKKRMEGKNVLFPMGWDAFGLPTENYAIKNHVKPQDATTANVNNFRRQLKMIGFGFDWGREVNTTDPAYYKWTQWMFLQFFKSYFDESTGRARFVEDREAPVKGRGERGEGSGDTLPTTHYPLPSARMAYKTTTTINWCPSCKIGLANEEAIGGVCERCGSVVEKREKAQWMIGITKYAERLIHDLSTVNYLERIKKQQIDWIGKSEGAFIDFKVAYGQRLTVDGGDAVRVFTTRPDTLFGVTYVVLAPEHEFVSKWIADGVILNIDEVRAYQQASAKKADMDRTAEGKEKTGVKLEGVSAINPANGEEVPVFIADYVLAGYGTGAVMAVPAHDERDFAFAKKYELNIVEVIKPKRDIFQAKYSLVKKELESLGTPIENPEQEKDWQKKLDEEFNGFCKRVELGEICWPHEGSLMNSREFNDRYSEDAVAEITSWLEKKQSGEKTTNYKLRDWIFSRQRYWGEPIPIVICPSCGYVPVPEEQLPVLLPDVESYEPTENGESPLAKIREWVETTCPHCGGKAERETDTMPNWAGSSWYFMRYCDPHNDRAFASEEALKYWMPVNLYNGGMEHTTLHLLYSRFWHKMMWDLKLLPESIGPEPYASRVSHGLILAQGGEKMSKSKGNVVNPDDVINEYGADVFRVYMMFIGPFDQPAPWDVKGIEGVKRFLDKVWRLFEIADSELRIADSGLETIYHQSVKKISSDIETLAFNTAVSQLMVLTNAFTDAGGVPEEMVEGYLKLLAPFAPHLAEELWHTLGKGGSVHMSGWPTYDETKTVSASFELVIQVNGKVRDRIQVPSDISEDEAKAKALASENVQKYLEGKEPKKIIYVKGKLVTIAM
ncbi:MAG: leucine--tRNA ligase [Candidatus Uhrbacteria bacterium]|nr:leucine--tRNA ligase [Candidatus Uhrbacteria bacterium]